MIKHGVVMVTLLILTLSLVGIVSASNITASDVEMQSFDQDNIQIEITENNELSSVDESSVSLSGDVELSSDDSVSLSGDVELSSDDSVAVLSDDDLISDGLGNSFKFNKDTDYELGFDATTSACNLLDFQSADDILVIASVDSSKIDDVTIKNAINGIIDASNGYITYEKGNLITLSSLKSDLIDIAFFSRKCEFLTMVFYENGVMSSIFSGNASSEVSVGLWDEIKYSLTDGIVNGVFCDKQKHFLTEQIFEQELIQTLFGCNMLEEPIVNADECLLGVSMDSDDNAVVWISEISDNNVYIGDSIGNESLIGLSMENNASENGMIAVMSYDQSNFNDMLKIENKLNPDINRASGSKDSDLVKLTSAEIKQIGVDAANDALVYFKSQGINVKKDYSRFYILTSAGYAKINGLNTKKAINGLLEVFRSKISKNVDLIQIPLWKDLIFYFIWVNDADKKDFVSYSLKYDPNVGELVESSKARKQGDKIVYILELFDNYNENHNYHNNGLILPVEFGHNFISPVSKVNITGNTNATNATNSSNASVKQTFLPKDELHSSKVNPFNILYTLVSIFMVCTIFGISYSKR
ncbi:MAG: hypothetical protein UHW99_05725 [Methanobrevibacter sp.]|nr:hypothetical protein [Methanobrevibacter sp.]